LLGEVDDEQSLWRLVRELVHKRVARVVPEIGKKPD
jgi:hypothetical protein